MQVRMKGLVKRGFASWDTSNTNPATFSCGAASYRKDESIRLTATGTTVSKYVCPDLISGLFGADLLCEVFRVEGQNEAFVKLREALAAAGFDVQSYEDL